MGAEKNDDLDIFPAIEACDHLRVEDLARSNSGVLSVSNEQGAMPIHWACLHGDRRMVEILKDFGDDLQKKEKWPRPNQPIHFAAVSGKTEIIEYLISMGVSVESRGGNDNTPLHFAAREGHLSAVRLLLEKGAIIDALSDDESTPLSLAAREIKEDVTACLIQKGANVNKANKNGATPLHYGVFRKNQNIIKILLDAGADIDLKDVRGDTPVSAAQKSGQSEIANLLLTSRGRKKVEFSKDALNDVLMGAAKDKGVVSGKEISFIPEAENVIKGGSEQIFHALQEASKGKHTYSPELVRRCCCYLFGKAVEVVMLWGRSSEGKFSVYYDSVHLNDLDLHPEVSSQYVSLVQKASEHGNIFFEAHMAWCETRLKSGVHFDLAKEVEDLFLMCSRFGITYGLEHKYHELTGGEKGTVYYEPPHSADVLQAVQSGMNFYQGIGCPKDLSKAFSYLKIAAEGGHVGSQYGLAMMYFRGEGTQKDPQAAFNWMLKAAENGFAQAQHEVSVFLFNGVGCKPDPTKAFFWCQKAADQNILESIFNMGLFLFKGVGTTPNKEQAISFFKKAEKLGHQGARDTLRHLDMK
jgi:TPR repeat protein/ankyrin repeat protein